jgi:hypothetical protein
VTIFTNSASVIHADEPFGSSRALHNVSELPVRRATLGDLNLLVNAVRRICWNDLGTYKGLRF